MGPKDTKAVPVLQSDPFFVCWVEDGNHRAAAFFAAGTAALFLMFWIALFVFVKRAMNSRKSNGSLVHASDSRLLVPLLCDLRPDAWYTNYFDTTLKIVLAVVLTHLSRPSEYLASLYKSNSYCHRICCIYSPYIYCESVYKQTCVEGEVRASLLFATTICGDDGRCCFRG